MTEYDIPPSWASLPFFQTRWPDLRDRLAASDNWQPKDIFRALRLCPREKTRVVILGQDPYPTPGRATGLAFSFPPGQPPRDSLKNILTELASDTGIKKPDGDLTGWAGQGVLLLNTALTVPIGQPLGHAAWGWQELALQVLAATLADGPRALVLWGNPAQKLVKGLDLAGHLTLASAHPSPLSAYRGFFGSRPFSAINRWRGAQGQPAIDWAA